MEVKTKKYSLFLVIYLFACAVQGPIDGGPVDDTPPNLISVIPENYYSNLSEKQKIVLTFNELIDPIAVRNSLSIYKQEHMVKVRGKKIIISPYNNWEESEIIDIYINRELSDFQNNRLSMPINLFYSLNGRIPKNYISGDSDLIIDKLPFHTIYLPLINRLFPSSKIIGRYTSG